MKNSHSIVCALLLTCLGLGAGPRLVAEDSESAAPQPDPALETLTNAPPTAADSLLAAREGLRRLRDLNGSTNALISAPAKADLTAQQFERMLEVARTRREQGNPRQAQALLQQLLESGVPAEVAQPALFEMGLAAQQNHEWTRAQQIYSTYIQRYPQDPSVPEVLLRQGLLYREMGAAEMALAKFYAVMTVALHVRLDRLGYYQRIVLQAQTEIAETQYQQNNFAQAAELYQRLLKLDAKEINRPLVQLKVLRCLAKLNHYTELTTEGEEYVKRYQNDPGCIEARFLLASAYNELGQGPAALDQVMLLLAARKPATGPLQDEIVNWQKRAGNEVANRFYTTGDYTHALALYRALAETNPAVDWRLPIWYQMGLIHERLQQFTQAIALYDRIATDGRKLPADAAPQLKIVLEMAAWRHKTLAWFNPADQAAKALVLVPAPIR